MNPVRRQHDYGVDLYCTLCERIGRREVVRDYFTAQVKSNLKPWVFRDRQSVRWLVEYPTPLFLAVVDKKKQVLRVYHAMPRFHVQALGKLPKRLRLKPEDFQEGKFVQREQSDAYSLSAPIIEATLSDLVNEKKMRALRLAFGRWVEFDRDNCDLVRFGLHRFRMPASYQVNKIPKESGTGELGLTPPCQVS